MIRPRRALACMLIAAGGSSLALAAPALPDADGDVPEADSTAPAKPAGPSLTVSPLRFEFDKAASGQTLRLINTGVQPLVVQLRLFAWDQSPDQDSFSPSRAVTISPSIATVAPGQTQIVRLVRSAPASAGEKRFRLTVDQLPDPKLDRGTAASTRLRFVLPVFVDRDQAPAARLDWRLAPGQLEVSNTGGQSARISSLRLTGSAGRALEFEESLGLRYVHGGRTVAWKLPNACSQGPIRVTADADGETVDVQPAPCG